MHPTRAAALLALAALAACNDSTLPPGENPAATPVLAFDYSGDIAGSWKAEGALHVPSAWETTWASGIRTGGRIEVQAVSQRADGRHDWVSINVPRTAPGTDTLRTGCNGEDGCPGVLVAFGMSGENGAQAETSCWLESGTLGLTSRTATRARGEFRGSGRCLTADGEEIEQFTIETGTFDIALR